MERKLRYDEMMPAELRAYEDLMRKRFDFELGDITPAAYALKRSDYLDDQGRNIHDFSYRYNPDQLSAGMDAMNEENETRRNFMAGLLADGVSPGAIAGVAGMADMMPVYGTAVSVDDIYNSARDARDHWRGGEYGQLPIDALGVGGGLLDLTLSALPGAKAVSSLVSKLGKRAAIPLSAIPVMFASQTAPDESFGEDEPGIDISISKEELRRYLEGK